MTKPGASHINILIVDDQRTVRTGLRRSLEAAGYAVSEAGNKAEALARLEQSPPVSLITLDLRLGDEDGLTLARDIRAKRNVPIIMITALTAPLDRVTGLEHGADDYITKPFHAREVLLRIQSTLRLYQLEREIAAGEPPRDISGQIYRSDAGLLHVQRRELTTASGNPIALTDAELDILAIFLRNPARILSRDDLSLALKGRPWEPTDRTLDGHIARLRKKIEPDIQAPRLIKTVWGVGYVFAGQVEVLDNATSPR